MARRGIEPMHDEHVNVTPLIDVVMCLIIFFMICGQIAQNESNDHVVVPTAALGRDLPEQRGRLVINVVPQDVPPQPGADIGPPPTLVVRGQNLSYDDLGGYLTREKRDNPDLKIVLRADRSLAYDYIAPVLIACAHANIKSVNFSVVRK